MMNFKKTLGRGKCVRVVLFFSGRVGIVVVALADTTLVRETVMSGWGGLVATIRHLA